MMTQLSVQQLVANHWALLDKNDEKTFHTTKLSPKEEALLDMLDGDLLGEKVIVFTKYKTWIDRLEWLTKNGHFTNRKFLRITGNENEKQRNDNKRLFQNSNDHDLIVINAAGLEGINLQQAAHMVLLDVPWSWGDLIQLVGRMVRMASPHSACTLHILISKGTIDEYAIETLKGKKGVFEKILGESHSAGLLDDKAFLDLESGMESGGSEEEYRSLLKAHMKKVAMKTFLTGDQIERAKGDENYKMVFESGTKKPGTKKGKILPDDKDRGKWKLDLL
jgi:SNF2 family DNA or RNA helicase